jgi:hypothetical protein
MYKEKIYKWGGRREKDLQSRNRKGINRNREN